MTGRSFVPRANLRTSPLLAGERRPGDYAYGNVVLVITNGNRSYEAFDRRRIKSAYGLQRICASARKKSVRKAPRPSTEKRSWPRMLSPNKRTRSNVLVGLIQGQLFTPPPARLIGESRLQAAPIAQSRPSWAARALVAVPSAPNPGQRRIKIARECTSRRSWHVTPAKITARARYPSKDSRASCRAGSSAGTADHCGAADAQWAGTASGPGTC